MSNPPNWYLYFVNIQSQHIPAIILQEFPTLVTDLQRCVTWQDPGSARTVLNNLAAVYDNRRYDDTVKAYTDSGLFALTALHTSLNQPRRLQLAAKSLAQHSQDPVIQLLAAGKELSFEEASLLTSTL